MSDGQLNFRAFCRTRVEGINDFLILRGSLLVIVLVAIGTRAEREHAANRARVAANGLGDEPLDERPLLRDHDLAGAIAERDGFGQFIAQIAFEIARSLGRPCGLPLWPAWNWWVFGGFL